MTRAFLLAVTGLAFLGLSSASAETVTQKAGRDATFKARDDDPAMKAAFAKAQESLPDFIDALDGKVSGASVVVSSVPETRPIAAKTTAPTRPMPTAHRI